MSIDWNTLEVQKVLRVDHQTKYIALLVNIKSNEYPNGAESVLLAHRQGFDSSNDFIALLNRNGGTAKMTLLERNDIYYRFLLIVCDAADCKVQLIHPATPAHVAKYTHQDRQLIVETPKMYKTIVEPWIKGQASTHIKWVDNILAGENEQERVLFSDADKEIGFVVLPDSKWDQRSVNALYMLAIVQRRDIRSLRDLNTTHLPLLRRIRECARTVISKKFPVSPGQLRMYVHYLPTYYYFHVHIVHVDLESPGCSVGGAHLLDDIIDNIELWDDYYQRRNLNYFLGVEHELYRIISE
jgi:m7GpppX diphosphatase